MIANPNKQISKMITLLKKLGISEQDCELAEKYLSSEVGDEVLDQFQRMNLLAASKQVDTEAWSITKQVEKEDKRAICVRFFNVVYAIGHGSCRPLFWYTTFNKIKECALYKRMIVYMDARMEYPGYLYQRDYNTLMEMAQNNPLNLIQALPFLKEEEELYAAAALALYFGKKYKTPDRVSAKDAEYMEEYEKIILKNFDEWLTKQGCTTHEKAIAAIREQKPAGNIIGRIELYNIHAEEKQRFYFICSLAYLNFQLSQVLMEVVRACAVMNAEETLNSFIDIYVGNDRARTNIAFMGADFEELFDIDSTLFICWAANLNYRQILIRQLEKNQESYLKAMNPDECRTLIYVCMRSKGFPANCLPVSNKTEDALNTLKDIMQIEKPELYQQVVQNVKPDHEQIINYLVADTPHAEIAREYLRGNCKVSALYPYDKEFGDGFPTEVYRVKLSMEKYKKHCYDQGFLDRCRVFLILRQVQTVDEIDNAFSENKGIEKFFAALDREQLDIAHQLQAFALMYKNNSHYYGIRLEKLEKSVENRFTEFLQERREETIQAFSKSPAEARFLALRILRKDTQANKQEILSYAKDSSSLVSTELFNILCNQKDWEDDIKKMLGAKKAAERELAIRVLLRWQKEGGNYKDILLQAHEKEKSTKLVTMLQRALDIQEDLQTTKPLSKEELVKQLHKGGKKRTLAWAYETPFSVVHKTNGETADEEYIQAIFLCYAAQIIRGVDENAQLLAADLNTSEFAVYVSELFDKWIAQGAEAKKGWVLFAASIHGNEEMIPKLYHQIQEWSKTARGLIAADAVRALALNPSPRALLLVDSIARKFKHKQVKNGAARALNEAAKQLGISREELADRIVPDLGFDEKMQRTFDYGDRTFHVMLTPSLDIEVYDETEKKLKDLPAPAKKDDMEKATKAYADFKEMKKQMKATVTSQKARLEYALSAKREWSVDAWKKLFVQNPLMHQFAIGLIWGIYEDNTLVQSFRYMEDGSFNTQDGEEYKLPEQMFISLVHPIELFEDSKAAWKEQLTDYEITQPIEQLNRTVYFITEEESDKKDLERFGGYVVNDLSLNGTLTKLGWYRGSVEDAGGYDTYYREDTESGMGVKLHFSGSFVGWHQEEVTIYEVRFYKAGDPACCSSGYDKEDKKKAYFLKDVPPRYFSEIVLQLSKVTVSSDERDEGWKKDAGL